jgi:hypothetical protein
MTKKQTAILENRTKRYLGLVSGILPVTHKMLKCVGSIG